jgi:D-alanyl-D-alanine carboxypeptidase (penicillin-binding protein 5/6)
MSDMLTLNRIISLVFLGTSLSTPVLAFETKATHAVIMDFDTGIFLYEKNAEQPMTPASMTKMMTAYLVFERLKDGRLSLDDEFTVSVNAWQKGGAASGGSTMFLEPNSKVRVEDLLKGVIVLSGNDACIVLAENTSGSEDAFAKEMTQKAQELGLTSANFTNVTGLYNENHVISAKDLAQLAAMIIRDHPEFYAFYSIPSYEWNDIRQPNRNPLLSRFEGADGLKTGHLEISGYGLTGSALVNGERRIVVLNGAESIRERGEISERLMRAAFREFDTATPFKAGDEIARAPVWLGNEESVALTLAEDFSFGYEIAMEKKLEAQIIMNGSITAPVKEGVEVGRLVVSGPDGFQKETSVFTRNGVGKVGIFNRALEGLASMLTPDETPHTTSGTP